MNNYYENVFKQCEKVNKVNGYIPKHDLQFRICLIGDSFVGKTSLLRRYYDRRFSEDYISTIGCDFKVITLEIDNKIIKLQLWDTAGQERFKAISVNYYRSAHAFMFVFDIGNKETFLNLNNWINLAFSNNKTNFKNILIGNKCDIVNREVTIEEGIELAKMYNMMYLETSASSDVMVNEAFNFLAYELCENCKDIKDVKGIISTDNEIISGENIIKVYNNEQIEGFKSKKLCKC